MAHLIDKSVLMAEINRLIAELIEKEEGTMFEQGRISAFEDLKLFLNTLEVKEVQEEPVSEDLKEAARDILDTYKPAYSSATSNGEPIEYYSPGQMRTMFMKGSYWQKEQFEKNRLAHCDALTKEQAQMESDFVTKHLKENNRTPTFIDAIEYGMKLQKEKMMKDGIDVEVKMDAGGYPYIDKTIELYDYDKDVPLANAGEKVKVIIMKED